MKNLLFIIAGLLLVIWAITYWGLKLDGSINTLPVIAGFIILVRIVFNKQLSNKYKGFE
ncbi:MAG: hypothetical protein JW894_05760 [Bacteroidales bacterium]|nr:hypothetical protein [Bacteroidales bacterium]